jgi:hypothetical protein
MNVVLKRTSSDDNGTFGEMSLDGVFLCYTCELPWKDNKTKISCIPEGEYKVTKFISPSKGNVFLLHNVPNRSMIEIHIGNTIKDIEGCIIVGTALGEINGLPAVLHSRLAFASLFTTMPEEFNLIITGVE